MGKYADANHALQRAFDLKDGRSDGETVLYKAWASSTLALGVNALVNQDVSTFEEAGLGYIEILEKAQQDKAGQVVEDVLLQFKEALPKRKQRKMLKAFEELELFIGLMKIKDPFEGWRALTKEISKVWPKGVSAVQAVREMRR